MSKESTGREGQRREGQRREGKDNKNVNKSYIEWEYSHVSIKRPVLGGGGSCS